MQYKFLNRNHNPRLLVIFAGWGMDYRLFDHLRHGAFDILVVWDYRQLYSEERGETRPFGYLLSRAQKYDEICILAWSFGVYAAQQVMDRLSSQLSRCIAVNGTVNPIHDALGIPKSIFRGTLDNLTINNWNKFFRRVCGTPQRMAEVEKDVPKRELEDLIEELHILGNGALQHLGKDVPFPHRKWDMAIISTRDAIFPIANQRAAWAQNTIIEVDGPHLPQFQDIINRYLIDKLLVAKRFSEAFHTYADNASVQAKIAQNLWQHIQHKYNLEACKDLILELGCGTCAFSRLYAQYVKSSEWQLWDIADVPHHCVPFGARVRKCDAEIGLKRLLPASVDAILSNCTVQWFGSPARFLQDCLAALKPAGLLAFTTFDRDNLPELKALGTYGLTTPALDEWREILPAGFTLIMAERAEHILHFPTPRKVVEHLRLTGVNALSSPDMAALRRFMTGMSQNTHPDAPDYTLTYRAITILAVKSK